MMSHPFYPNASRHVAKTLCIALVTAQLAGCSTWQQSSSEAVASAHTLAQAQWQRETAAIDSAALSQWWSQFGDATLTGLVEQALAANNSIAAAEGRLRASRAALGAARGAQLPSVSASGSGSRQETLDSPDITTENYNLGLDVSWEVDLFGKLRSSSAAAAANLAGSAASLHDIQRIITADVAFNYINLRDSQARLAIAKDNLAIQEENLRIAQWRNQAGLGNALEVEQAKTAVAQTRAIVPALEQGIVSAINQIDLLLGQSPGYSQQLLMPPAPLPSPPAVAGLGLPAELLQRRPDVLAAQHTLEAEILRIGVAEADLYPALRLGGFLDTSATSASNLFDTSLAGLIGNVTAPIFQGGQIRARIEQQKGSADTALANYRQIILAALLEVDNALQAGTAAQQRESALLAAEQSAVESHRLAEIRYRAGSIDFQTLLDAQRSLLAVQDSRASASAARASASVQLFKALGGGWNAAQRQ